MLDHDKGHAAGRRHMAQELLERLESTRRIALRMKAGDWEPRMEEFGSAWVDELKAAGKYLGGEPLEAVATASTAGAAALASMRR